MQNCQINEDGRNYCSPKWFQMMTVSLHASHIYFMIYEAHPATRRSLFWLYWQSRKVYGLYTDHADQINIEFFPGGFSPLSGLIGVKKGGRSFANVFIFINSLPRFNLNLHQKFCQIFVCPAILSNLLQRNKQFKS